METIKGYTVKAGLTGKSWESRYATVRAESEQEAIIRAKEILRLNDEHQITTESVQVHRLNSKLTVDSYPYGRLRTTAYFSIEYNKGKGCRSVFQTIDPKTGRLNKEKKSTYTGVIMNCTNESNGHIEGCGYLDFNGTDAINKGLHFMNDFKELFSPEILKDIACYILGMMKVNAKAQCIYCGTKIEDLMPYYENQLKNMVNIAKGESTDFTGSLLRTIREIQELEKLNLKNRLS